jgi:hypothetical protein
LPGPVREAGLAYSYDRANKTSGYDASGLMRLRGRSRRDSLEALMQQRDF